MIQKTIFMRVNTGLAGNQKLMKQSQLKKNSVCAYKSIVLFSVSAYKSMCSFRCALIRACALFGVRL